MPKSLDEFNNLPEAFFEAVVRFPDEPVYNQATLEEGKAGKRRWYSRSFSEVSSRIKRITAFLQSVGVVKGQRIAIISNSRPEWMEADFAILNAGGIVVSVYQSLTANEIGFILYDSGAEIVFVENEEQVQKLETLKNKTFPIPATEENPASEVTINLQHVISFEFVRSKVFDVKLISDVIAQADEKSCRSALDLKRQDLATIVYTSGTTGAPKGVMQTHGNHLANVRQARNAQMYDDLSTIFLMLPLAHSFAKLMGYICFLNRTELLFPAIANPKSSRPDPASVSRDMREGSARMVPIVPRMLEKIQSKIEEKSHAPGIKGKLLRTTLWAGNLRAKAKRNGIVVPASVQIVFLLTTPMRRLIRNTIFGPRFQNIISGGAKLPRAVAEFFDGIDIEILEGYGLTETCVATNVNRRGLKKLGSVGPLLDSDIQIKIEADGEVLFKGPNITLGYYKRPTATKAAWDSEGWFHTGDLGEIDKHGFLYITGRKKELIVTSGGKKIPPDPIEQEIKKSEFVSQVVLFGDERQYLVAVITLNHQTIEAWAKKNSISISSDPSQDKTVFEMIWKSVQEVNQRLASYETVKKIYIAAEDFTAENTLLTPTFKVKRKEVFKKYQKEIDKLYQA